MVTTFGLLTLASSEGIGALGTRRRNSSYYPGVYQPNGFVVQCGGVLGWRVHEQLLRVWLLC